MTVVQGLVIQHQCPSPLYPHQSRITPVGSEESVLQLHLSIRHASPTEGLCEASSGGVQTKSEVTVTREAAMLFPITTPLPFNCSESNVLVGRDLFSGDAVLDTEVRDREILLILSPKNRKLTNISLAPIYFAVTF